MKYLAPWCLGLSGLLLCTPVVAQTVDSGSLLRTYEISEIGYMSNGQLINAQIDLSGLPIRPDFVTVEAEAQISIANSCTQLLATVNGVTGGLTGAPDTENGFSDCNETGTTKDNRTYTTASVKAPVSSSQTSIPITLQALYTGSNSGASAVRVRLLRVNAYSRTQISGGSGISPVSLSSDMFSTLALEPSLAQLFGGYYVNFDNQVGSISATTSQPTGPIPTQAQWLYLYLPPNSLYDSQLRYGPVVQTSQVPHITVEGVNSSNKKNTVAAYGNTLNLTALNLKSVSYLSGALYGNPRSAILTATPNSPTVARGATSVTLTIGTSGIDPATLRVQVNNGEETSPVINGNAPWSDLVYKGQTNLSVTLPDTSTSGKVIPIIVKAQAISQQVHSQSFTVKVQ